MLLAGMCLTHVPYADTHEQKHRHKQKTQTVCDTGTDIYRHRLRMPQTMPRWVSPLWMFACSEHTHEGGTGGKLRPPRQSSSRSEWWTRDHQMIPAIGSGRRDEQATRAPKFGFVLKWMAELWRIRGLLEMIHPRLPGYQLNRASHLLCTYQSKPGHVEQPPASFLQVRASA